MNDREPEGRHDQSAADAPAQILIVEDSPTQAAHLRHILERHNYNVCVAANGKIALGMLSHSSPSLVISDIVMPEMDGYELSRAMKNDPQLRDIPIILVTTMSDPRDVIRGLECGADNFVLKPYEPRYLLARIRYVLVNREMRRPNDAGMGVEIYFEGRRHFITADRLQILNLLLSTYDAAIQRNKELQKSQEELQGTNSRLNELKLELEHRVRKRTEELQRSNEALRDSEARLRLTIDTALDAVITIDERGLIRDWNTQAEVIFGWSADEAAGKSAQELFKRDLASSDPLPELEQYLTTSQGTLLNRRVEVVALRRDGSEFPAELSMASMDHHGTRMFSAFIRDITERVRSEKHIRDLSRINELILNHAAEGILAFSVEGDLIFANPAARRLLGWDETSPISDVHMAIHPDHADGCSLGSHLSYEEPHTSETTFASADGRRLDVRYTAAPILENDVRTGTVITFADITEHNRVKRQLEQTYRVSSLGRVAATMAHEFNNVLMGIQPFAELIRRRAEDEKLEKAAGQIMSSVARGRRITEEILRFTQPSEPALLPLDVGDWLRGLMPELQSLAGDRARLDLQVRNEPLTVAADAVQLQQVLTNLVINARDSIPDRGIITITAAPADRANGSRDSSIVMSVADTGSGMDPTVLEHMFDPLFTTKRSGTGLGLAVAQQVINHHHGSIRADSIPGKGTTFVIQLPCVTAQASSTVEPQASPQFSVSRVLLVEDEPMIVSGVTLLLSSEGIGVSAVGKGHEALPAIEEFSPDVVILDWNLADMSGTEVYKMIAARYPQLPVIFSSGHGEHPSFDELVETRRVGFLSKPYTFDVLLSTIGDVMARAESSGSPSSE